ncbi:CrcB family protein [Castellaniella sp.]|uniref:CrcB family protein n=1 Tax=Castellaniella sp. TaxID=1955812 RepID=UPI00345D047B
MITGFMGGLTTLSTFSLEATTLLQAREFLSAATHIGLHLFGSIFLTLAGIGIVQYRARG